MLKFIKKKQDFHKWWNTDHLQILIKDFVKIILIQLKILILQSKSSYEK